MAFIGLGIPHQTARLFGDIDVSGKRTDSTAMHVTILYIGQDIPVETLAEVVKSAYTVTSRTRPFTVRTTRVSSFPKNPDDKEGYPIIAHVESDALHELRDGLAQALDDAGIDYSKKWPTYRPHVTLSYAEEAVDEFRIPTIEWPAHEIVMWGGDEGDRKLTVVFPLALKPSANEVTASAISHRVVERFKSAAPSQYASQPIRG